LQDLLDAGPPGRLGELCLHIRKELILDAQRRRCIGIIDASFEPLSPKAV
jgi:hypothetical protein